MRGGITLARARKKLEEAKSSITEGLSPAREKARSRKRDAAAETFGEWADLWLVKHVMAESTRDMRRAVYEGDLKSKYASLKMWEITDEDLRSLCDRIVARAAPATAVQVGDIVLMVFRFANERGHNYSNPAERVKPHTIAVFHPLDRALSPADINAVYQYFEHVATTPVIRLTVKLLLLTMLRESELIMAEWSEVNFTEALWTIPAKRMQGRNPHNVFLSRQAMDVRRTQIAVASMYREITSIALARPWSHAVQLAIRAAANSKVAMGDGSKISFSFVCRSNAADTQLKCQSRALAAADVVARMGSIITS